MSKTFLTGGREWPDTAGQLFVDRRLKFGQIPEVDRMSTKVSSAVRLANC